MKKLRALQRNVDKQGAAEGKGLVMHHHANKVAADFCGVLV